MLKPNCTSTWQVITDNTLLCYNKNLNMPKNGHTFQTYLACFLSDRVPTNEEILFSRTLPRNNYHFSGQDFDCLSASHQDWLLNSWSINILIEFFSLTSYIFFSDISWCVKFKEIFKLGKFISYFQGVWEPRTPANYTAEL